MGQVKRRFGDLKAGGGERVGKVREEAGREGDVRGRRVNLGGQLRGKE